MRRAGTRAASSRARLAAALLVAGGVGLAWWPVLDASTGPWDALRRAKKLPAIVYVERGQPLASDRDQIPGVGPRGRTRKVGGRLVVREKDGRTRALLPDGALFDTADPAVSWDATTIVFAGLVHPDSSWRIYRVNADGTGFAPVTRTLSALDLGALGTNLERFAHYDDFDPTFLPDGRIVFASTRFPQPNQFDGGPAANLFVVIDHGIGIERVTTERNGAEEPSIVPKDGHLVYARWFFSPYRASDVAVGGVTRDIALALQADSVNLWQAISTLPNGDLAKLAGGDPRGRRSALAYQPIVLGDGSLVGIRPEHAALLPAPGPTALVVYPGGIAEPRVLVARDSAVATGRALSPAALPDGRILFSFDPSGSGVFGLAAIAPDGKRAPEVVLAPGERHLLDAVPLVARKVPPIDEEGGGLEDPPSLLPAHTMEEVTRMDDTFRFDCLNVFTNGPVDAPFPNAPSIAQGVKIRFFALLARPNAAGGDSLVMIREADVTPTGGVHEHDIPADVSLFEQLVDSKGRILRSTMGPAHVPGSNFARVGSGTKCVGCHAGHSALPVPDNYMRAYWFNAATSATVTVTSRAEGSAPPEALVDRRAKGPVSRTGWVAAAGADSAEARLEWALPIECQAFVLYAPSPDRDAGTDLTVRSCELIWSLGGKEVGRRTIRRPLSPGGTRVDISPSARIDAVVVRPTNVRGTVEHRRVVALAEIETIARLIED